VVNPSINTANNRLNTSEDYSFDAAGNLVVDAEGRQFTYDAENKQVEVENGSSQLIGQYYFDGDGKRVKKISSTETTVFVYNASGTLVAEYSTDLASTPRTSYLTSDHLGSPRVVTDQLGAVVSRHDYTGFGKDIAETLGATTGGRTSAQGYGASDEVRKQYTGYERDDESGLEYAQARYYNGDHGRFTSVDPLTASASIRNPQTFNRYSYVLNSPYKYVDPLGLISSSTGACGQWCQGLGPYMDGSDISGRDASFDWAAPDIVLSITAVSENADRSTGPITKEHRKKLEKNLNKLVRGAIVTEAGKVIIPGMVQNTAGYRLLTGINTTGRQLTIVVNDRNVNAADARTLATVFGVASDAKIFWDPNYSSTVEVRAGPNKIRAAKTNSAVVLAHEMIHAYNYMRPYPNASLYDFVMNRSVDPTHYFTEGGVAYSETAHYEEFRTLGLFGNLPGDITENDIRRQLGYRARMTYRDRKYWIRTN